MKTPIYIEQFNGIDFLGSRIIPCDESDAEFYVVLHDGEKLVKGEDSTYLVKDGVLYEQQVRMQTFKGVAFREVTESGVDERVIKRELISAKKEVV